MLAIRRICPPHDLSSVVDARGIAQYPVSGKAGYVVQIRYRPVLPEDCAYRSCVPGRSNDYSLRVDSITSRPHVGAIQAAKVSQYPARSIRYRGRPEKGMAIVDTGNLSGGIDRRR